MTTIKAEILVMTPSNSEVDRRSITQTVFFLSHEIEESELQAALALLHEARSLATVGETIVGETLELRHETFLPARKT